MTGYGRSALQMENLSLFLEIASVNKRHLEIFISAPKEWQKFEYDAIFQKQKLETVIEHRHLQETLEKLREELDKNNG